MTRHWPSDTIPRVPWPPLLLAGLFVLAIFADRIQPLTWPGMDDVPARVIGLGIGLAGLLLVAWSILTLRRHGTTILPTAQATALVTDGPYRRFRNPIYLGDVMILLGLAELTKNVWVIAAAGVFVALVTSLAILPEERYLEARFGDDYRAYKAKTRRWI